MLRGLLLAMLCADRQTVHNPGTKPKFPTFKVLCSSPLNSLPGPAIISLNMLYAVFLPFSPSEVPMILMLPFLSLFLGGGGRVTPSIARGLLLVFVLALRDHFWGLKGTHVKC